MISKLEKAIMKTNDDLGVVSEAEHRVLELESELENMSEPFLLDQKKLDKKKIIHGGMKDQQILKNFADVSYQILQRADSMNGQVVMVTSISQKSGVSYVSRNLAAAIAMDSTRSSLLLDCHFSRPSQQKVLGLGGKKGISEFISNEESDLGSLIQPVGIHRMRCLPAGKSKTSDSLYFKHPRMKTLLSHLRQRYANRDVIIDCPPLNNDFGSKMLLDYCDQVVLVVPYGKVKDAELNNALAMIGSEKIAGVVMNK